MKLRFPSTLVFTLLAAMVIDSNAEQNDKGRVYFPVAQPPVFGWQKDPMPDSKGGAKFSISAFVYPLATPSGFVCTDIQPDDHLHHLGIWWPLIEFITHHFMKHQNE